MFRVSTKVIVFACAALGFASIAAAQMVAPNPNPTPRPSIIAANVGTGTRGPSIRQLPTIPVPNPNPQFDGTCMNPAPEQLDPLRCTTRYMACLRMDSVCGANFELCDTRARFNHRRIFCQNELARCPADVISGLFGTPVTQSNDAQNMRLCDGEWVVVSRTFYTTVGGRQVATSLNDIELRYNPALRAEQESAIGREIWLGSQWAANNAVATCRNTADACITRACRQSPHRCMAVGSLSTANYTEIMHLVNEQSTLRVPRVLSENYVSNMLWTVANVRNYLSGECKIDIGSNEHCFMVANPRTTPAQAAASATDEFEMQITYDQIMTGTMNRLNAMQPRIREWLAQAVANSIQECAAVTEECVKQACGNGSMAACYGAARETSTGRANLMQTTISRTIRDVCEPIVVHDQNCLDILARGSGSGDGENRDTSDMWVSVWGRSTSQDETSLNLGIRLSNELTNTFGESGLARIRVQCQTEAENCVHRECGSDLSRCFVRNLRSANEMFGFGDNIGDDGAFVSESGVNAGGFARSMAMNLCLIPVKRTPACQDWFDVQYAIFSQGRHADAWGWVRNDWLNQRSNWDRLGGRDNQTREMCTPTMTYFQFNQEENEGFGQFGEPIKVDSICRDIEQNIFDNLIADISRRAQAEALRRANDAMNQCVNRNRNVVGMIPNFVWAEIPDIERFNPNEGLMVREITQTADMWNGFCAAKVTMQSEDTELRETLNADRFIRYFSVGDTFICGGWLARRDMEAIEARVRADRERRGLGNERVRSNAGLYTVMAALGGGAGANVLFNTIQRSVAGAPKSCEVRGNCEICGREQAVNLDNGVITVQPCGTLDHLSDDQRQRIERFEEARETAWEADRSGSTNATQEALARAKRNVDDAIIRALQSNPAPVVNNSQGQENRQRCESRLRRMQDECRQANDNRNSLFGFGGGGQGGWGQGGMTALNMALTGGAAWWAGDAANRAATENARRANAELMEAKKDEAVAEWFNNVGTRIQCVMNGRQVGSFGDLIEVR